MSCSLRTMETEEGRRHVFFSLVISGTFNPKLRKKKLVRGAFRISFKDEVQRKKGSFIATWVPI